MPTCRRSSECRLRPGRCAPGEDERLATQLSGILAHMEELREVDVRGVPAFTGAAEHVAPPAADEPGPDPLVRPLGAFAPDARDGLFTVPRLIAQRGAGAGSA
jgi:aspartyl-tRNA(Asn)/glutamyl-tRNA(Gln) amidotransferase subunit C